MQRELCSWSNLIKIQDTTILISIQIITNILVLFGILMECVHILKYYNIIVWTVICGPQYIHKGGKNFSQVLERTWDSCISTFRRRLGL